MREAADARHRSDVLRRAGSLTALAHWMRNLQAKVPETAWPEFKARALACFMEDFEVCIAQLRFPITHRRSIRTTNLLERLFGEERRRVKIVANAFGERPVLKLIYASLIRGTERWRGLRVVPFEAKQLEALRA